MFIFIDTKTISIFIHGEGEKIKSKQAPNRDRTLPGELC